jgi:hypothetical protein
MVAVAEVGRVPAPTNLNPPGYAGNCADAGLIRPVPELHIPEPVLPGASFRLLLKQPAAGAEAKGCVGKAFLSTAIKPPDHGQPSPERRSRKIRHGVRQSEP